MGTGGLPMFGKATVPDITNLYSGFVRASRYQRVPTNTLERALKPYSITLASLRGMNDAALRKRASDAVIKKYLGLGSITPAPTKIGK